MNVTGRKLLPSTSLVLACLVTLAVAPAVPAQKTVAPPAKAPATVDWNARKVRLSLRYHGGEIFDDTVRAENATGKVAAGVEGELRELNCPSGWP